jgi:hypothetical protein
MTNARRGARDPIDQAMVGRASEWQRGHAEPAAEPRAELAARMGPVMQSIGCEPPELESILLDDPGPFLEVSGVEGSRLRATLRGLTVLAAPGDPDRTIHAARFWEYERLSDVRLEVYGPLGVLRANVRATGHDLPLLLVDPTQITSARRVLEMVWNIMDNVRGRVPA